MTLPLGRVLKHCTLHTKRQRAWGIEHGANHLSLRISHFSLAIRLRRHYAVLSFVVKGETRGRARRGRRGFSIADWGLPQSARRQVQSLKILLRLIKKLGTL